MSDILKTLASTAGNPSPPTFLASDSSPPDADNPLVRLTLAPEPAESIAGYGRAFMLKLVRGLTDGALAEKPYDASSVNRDHEVEIIDLDPEDDLFAGIEPFSRPTDARAYSKAKDGLRNFNLAAMTFPRVGKSQPVILFKKQSQPLEVRSTRKIRLYSSKNEFDQLAGATFAFDDHFDSAYVAGRLVVLQKENFHTMFGFYEGLKAFVSAALPTLQKMVPIENFADLEAVCLADKSLMKRLRRTMASIPPNFDPVRFAAMIRRDGIPVKIAGTETKPTFVFEKAARHDFFNLLEDGFLNSSATDRLYEANSKRVRVPKT